MKLIDKDALVAEIKRKIRTEQGYSSGDAECGYRDCARDILSFIDSLQKEPVSEDLEEACEQLAENARKHKAETISPFFSPTDYKQGVIDGANWKEQQMMKDAVNGWVFRDIKEGKLRISDNKECWNGIRIPEKSIEKSYLICTTDDAIKVKLVIVKED